MACLNTPATNDDRSKLRHRYLRRSQGCASVDQAGSGLRGNQAGYCLSVRRRAWDRRNRTAQLGSDIRMSCATFYAKQSTAACEHIAAPAVGKKAEVTDADQPLRQNVDQESA